MTYFNCLIVTTVQSKPITSCGFCGEIRHHHLTLLALSTQAIVPLKENLSVSVLWKLLNCFRYEAVFSITLVMGPMACMVSALVKTLTKSSHGLLILMTHLATFIG